jgi:RimJ/RimL family protein N-acetyltransferase
VPTLLTDRLALRLLGAQDAALYRSLYTCPRVMARIGTPLTDAAAGRAFAAALAHNGRDTPGHRTFAAFDRATGSAVGIAALARAGGRAEIGLMLLPRAWDGRRSHEVLDALVAYGFGPMALDVLDAACREGPNVRPGRRLVQPYGFVEVPAGRRGTVQWELLRSGAIARAEVGRVTFAE